MARKNIAHARQRFHGLELALRAQGVAEGLHAGVDLAALGLGALGALAGGFDDEQHVRHECPLDVDQPASYAGNVGAA